MKGEPYEDDSDMSDETTSVKTHEVDEAVHRLLRVKLIV